MTSRFRRGWLGGTFDPIHYGHMDVAHAAREALALDVVTLVPSGHPPHRSQPHASVAERLAMTRSAATEPWMEVSTSEIDHDGVSYTADTLDRLVAHGEDLSTLVVIVGADAFGGIHTWHRSADLLARVTFAVVSRPDHPAPALRQSLPELSDRMCAPVDAASARHPSIILIDAPTAAVSSTSVRAAVAAGRPLTGLVPEAVEAYISAHGLYSR
jgi:nicotinate-nucleotide adenylyltransferase